MPHPIMFDETDPLLARVRALVLAYPGAQEKISHGRPFFFTKTSFAVYGGSEKDTRAAFPRSLIVKPDADERLALLGEAHTYLPMYLGPSGWVGYDLDRDTVDWAEVAELVDMSFRETAPVKLVRELDERLG
ncbi:MmcQ/YjbR family DNA-binding protein [Rhodococcus artemisiae]|uniref:MmcQ/YjbR family DNA-binding protein n=1 Tax=Rhodococcus artemisiae TaxID=714159 RepID=A0ABU7LJX3_9NOCA|nr:MmcQ/YjbR family DNA-binding protein [Rhodococcus artemisiae]MEE2061845.1 MmcQ/YjbR family DNA-binding protein [Rhodococcus artemisiae]